MIAFAFFLLVCCAAFGYGLLVARGLRLDFSSRLERAAVAVALGTGLLMLAVLALGHMGLVRRDVYLVLLVPAAGYGLWRMRRGEPNPSPVARPRWARTALIAALAICATANLLGASAPPSFIDALIYHLFGPKEYVRHGAIIDIPFIWQLYSPSGVEMLYTLGQALHGPRVPGFIDMGLGLLATAGTALVGRRLAGPLAGLIAAAVFYCTAMVAWESTSCFVDLGVAAFAILGVYALLRWMDQRRAGWLIAAGLLMGFASSCKMNGAIFVVAATGVLVLVSYRRGAGLRRALGPAVVFGAVATLTVLPWFVRAYILAGNPFYPFGTQVFGPNPDIDNVRWVLKSYGLGHRPVDLLLAPWRLLSRGGEFENGQHFNPAPVLLAPIIAWRATKNRDVRILLGTVLLLFVVWLLGGHVARYLVPLQPIQAALAADAVLWLLANGRRRQILGAAVAGLFVAFGTVNTLLYNRQFAAVVTGRESEAAYLSRTSWFYTLHAQLNRELPPDARLLTNLGPTYYLDRPHVRARASELRQDPETLARVIEEGGFTHVLLQGEAELQPYIAALGQRVERVWRRQVDVPVSRTFGGTAKEWAVLFRVNR